MVECNFINLYGLIRGILRYFLLSVMITVTYTKTLDQRLTQVRKSAETILFNTLAQELMGTAVKANLKANVAFK